MIRKAPHVISIDSKRGASIVKKIKIVSVAVLGSLLAMQQAVASESGSGVISNPVVPEIDGAGAIVAIALIAGVVAFVREKFFR